MAKFPGFPVFDTADRLSEQADLGGYKTILSRLSELPMGQDSLERDLILSLQYLQDYAGTPGTYNRFRGEVQRFLNYLWVIAKRTLDQVDSEVVASYFKFLKTPPGAWVAPNIASGFANQGGERVINPKWRPFTRQRSRGPLYSASPASLKSSRVALSSYFRFLMARRVILEDPFLQVRKRETKAKSGYLLEQPEASVRRYTDWQWAYIRETVETAADQNSRYERHLFVIITMKSLFLRVSELAVRSIDGEPRLPTFGDYQKRVFKDSSYWTFYVFGKGEKGRTITCPNAYMSYLKRWRKHLCSDTPYPYPLMPPQFFRPCEAAAWVRDRSSALARKLSCWQLSE